FSAVWTGDRMIVWGGGELQEIVLRNGGAYVPFGENRAPVAVAHAADRVECTSFDGGPVHLDATASSDPDSAPGGAAEIASYEWIEGLGTTDEHLLGTGAQLDVQLPLGAHDVALRVTDVCGSTGTDAAAITVEDTIAPSLVLKTDPAVLWPPDHRMRAV